MAKFYANENFPLPAVQVLRSMGHDVLTSTEAGQANLSLTDNDVLLFARQQKRILLTFNRKHFIRLHQESCDHAGIIACTFDPDFLSLANHINQTLQENEPMDSRLVRISRLS
jgi:hypothetical protein